MGKNPIRPVIFLSSLTGLFILYSQPFSSDNSLLDHGVYLVETEGCRLMEMDPWDSSVNKFFKKPHPIHCNPQLIQINNQTLHYNKELLASWKFEGAVCCYRKVSRVTQDPSSYHDDADDKVKLDKKCVNIPQNGTRVHDEYILVQCVNKLKVKVYDQIFWVVLPPEEQSPGTINKTDFWNTKKQPIKKPVNVLIIGVDSISRMHMTRSLPRTKEFLKEQSFTEMKGYTKVGENTFPNIMAALGGMSPSEFKNCWPDEHSKFDDCPFVWKNFSQGNYMTAFLEDSPGISIFNYAKLGFVTPPADYYLRPLMLAQHKFIKGNQRGKCMGSRTSTQVMLDYIHTLSQTFGSKYPFFIFSWFTSIGHDDFNGIQLGDGDFRNLLENVVREQGDNTVIFFISDHGYRFGRFRETFLGYYEESLPFFFVRLPSSLKERMPNWNHFIETNSHRLTTPFDLYGSLIDIYNLEFPEGLLVTNRTESFFRPSPLNRTCESSHIPQKYCMCGVNPEAAKSPLSSKLGQWVVSKVNDETANQTKLCIPLKYKSVLYGRQIGHGHIWNHFGKLSAYKDFLIGLETNPVGGKFEARIRATEGKEGDNELLGEISRINSYKGESDCVTNSRLKNYCLCTNSTVLAKKLMKKKKQKKTKH